MTLEERLAQAFSEKQEQLALNVFTAGTDTVAQLASNKPLTTHLFLEVTLDAICPMPNGRWIVRDHVPVDDTFCYKIDGKAATAFSPFPNEDRRDLYVIHPTNAWTLLDKALP